ncbi:MAG TPA: Dabb family protein [Blastocatellia bacterium]|nr:Dabb family protein [Blastocatellia bacterium]
MSHSYVFTYAHYKPCSRVQSQEAVVIAIYDDLEALEKYQRHDSHVPVAMKLRSLCDAIGAVDFEY